MIEISASGEDFATFVARRFKGHLAKGAHNPNGVACFHEALNVYQGRGWSDDTSGTLDLRGLNDAPWSSDEARTAAMLPLGALALGWPSWSPERRVAWARRVSQETIRRILPLALRAAASVHPDEAHKAALTVAAATCADEGTESAAWSARSAAWLAAASAAESARSAAGSAEWSAARSARSSAWSAWSARSAAWAAAAAAEAAESAQSSASAEWSAEAAARSAAWSAAESAAESDPDEPLRLLATILVEATEVTK